MIAEERFPRALASVDHVEPVARRIRGMLDGEWVLDTTRALYLWEWAFYPQYLIPAEDVAQEMLIEEGEPHRLSRGEVVKVGLRSSRREKPSAGRRYVESSIDGLAGMIRFDWDALDAWFEEEQQVYVHPRNPYVRVDALRSSRAVRVELDGTLLAESDATVMVFETGLPTRYYFDPATVSFAALLPSATVTECPYKGRTSAYWSVQTPNGVQPDLVWSYAFPTAALEPIAGLVAFYDEKLDVFLDGVKQPRPVTHFFTS